MKRKVFFPTLAALVITASTALAWGNVTGIVRSIDTRTNKLVLDDGRTYTAQGNVDLRKINTGDTVRVSVQTQDGKNMVNKVTRLRGR